MTSDQVIAQDSMIENLRRIQKAVDDAEHIQYKDDQGGKEATLKALRELYQEQFEKLNNSERAIFLEHPGVQLVADEITDPDDRIYNMSRAVKILAYLNEAPLSEASNPVFPGYTGEKGRSGNNTIVGIDNPSAQGVYSIAYVVGDFASDAMFKAYGNATRPQDVKAQVGDMEKPEGATVIDEDRNPLRDARKYAGREGLEEIAAVRDKFIETGTINPYQLAAITAQGAQTYLPLKVMATTLGIDTETPRAPVTESVFSAYSPWGLQRTLGGDIFNVDQEISIKELAEQNGLSAKETEMLELDIHKRLAMASLVVELKDLSQKEGMIAWGAANLDSVGDLFKDGILNVEMLDDAPGLDENTIQRVNENIRVIEQADRQYDALRRGLDSEQYDAFKSNDRVFFMRDYVADNMDVGLASPDNGPAGVEAEPEVDTGISVGDLTFTPIEERQLDYEFRIPGLSGFKIDEDRVSTGLFTDPDGDGLRIGIGAYDRVVPEAFWRQDIGLGNAEAGLISFGLGDYDGIMQTPRPGREDHISTLSGFGARFHADSIDLDVGFDQETEFRPSAFILYDTDLDESIFGADLRFSQDIDIFNVRGGGTVTSNGTDTRYDAFGEGRVYFGDPVMNFGHFAAGVQTTNGTALDGPFGQDLTTGYGELRLQMGPDHWGSNLSAIFGVSANTDDVQNYYSGLMYNQDIPDGSILEAGVIFGHEDGDMGMGSYVMPSVTWRF